jgi:uncharacterized protein (TIGR04222 family)
MQLPFAVWIANMPGPQFLQLYAGVIAATLFGAWYVMKRSDSSAEAPRLIIPRNPDPYEIACLRGGYREMIWLAVFSLTEKGYVEALQDGWKRQAVHPDPALLTLPEREVLNWLTERRSAADVAGAKLPGLSRECQNWEERFRAMGVMAGQTSDVPRLVACTGMALIAALGAFKLIVALFKGRHNIGGIIAFAIIGMVGVLFICAYRPRLTAHGRRYLKDWQHSFDGLKIHVQNANSAMMNPAAMLAVGVFGVTVLAASPYEQFRRLHAGPDTSGSSSSGSCGSGGDGGGCGGGGCGGCS